MFAIVGLGNPGSRYRKTRHNLGYMVLDDLADRWNKRFRKGAGFYKIIKTDIDSHRILLAKPTTFMNISGVSVGDISERYGVELSRFLIVCDDLNLPLGRIRLRKKGSHGGHKGLASIIDEVGTHEFPRLRLGIGFNDNTESSEYVLSDFLFDELPVVNQMVETGGRAVVDFVTKGIDWTMNVYNV